MERVLLAVVHWQDAPEQRVVWFVWRRTWQRYVSWRTHTAQRLDSGLPSHAPVTGHSIKEARQAPTSPWSPHRARCQRKAERPHVYARSCQDGCKFGYSTSQRVDSHPKCIHTGVASSNASTASPTTVSTLGDGRTDYGLGKPAVAGEERFRSLTELKWDEFEADGLRGPGSG